MIRNFNERESEVVTENQLLRKALYDVYRSLKNFVKNQFESDRESADAMQAFLNPLCQKVRAYPSGTFIHSISLRKPPRLIMRAF
jgi:hypothetical protein